MAVGRRGHGQGSARGDRVGPNPTDRGKNGTKRSVLTEADGGPLAVVVAGANVHDARLLEETIHAVVVQRPDETEVPEQNLCLDKGYDNPTGRAAASSGGHVPHVRPIGEDRPKRNGDRRRRHKPRRWVVERTIGWLNRCRGILVRYEKKAANFLAFVKVAAMMVLLQ